MLMLRKGTEVTRDQLREIQTPEPTESWCPVSHFDVVNTLTDRASACGLKIRNERFAVVDGSLHSQFGEPTRIPGARLYGSMDFEPIPGIPFPEGCTPSAGLRNSHDKTFCLSILSGARILVCENGALMGDHQVNRKHTSGIDLLESIDNALNAFMASITGFNEMFQRLNARRLTRTKAHSLVVEAARAGAFASDSILPIVAEFENPQHEAFKDRTAWSLYNAATEAMKKQSPGRQVDGFKALNQVLVAELN
ncbi:MAG: DUF932 domain-containing protein [Planctomycetota bacterium]